MSHLLTISDLTIAFTGDTGTHEVTDHLSLTLDEGEVVCLVGESGCGKSVTSMSLLGLLGPGGSVKEGSICYEDRDLLTLSEKELDQIRGKEISMIFQDPMTSLNPVMTVGDQIMESIRNHEKLSRRDAAKKAKEILELVGIPYVRAEEYPHQFSGGMKQRVVIAIALACNPRVLIADEPTTALDVTIQAQVLETIRDLRQKFHTSMLLITHDLGVIAQNCEYVSVIYAGEIVETGTVHDIFGRKLHPYTQGLFSSIPNINETVTRLIPINGLMPDPTALPEGCAFCERCKYAEERCSREHPSLYAMGGEENIHQVRCFRYEQNGEGR